MSMDEEERYLLETTASLRDAYQKAAEPYINRLCAIYARRRPPEPMVIMIERDTLWGPAKLVAWPKIDE